MFARLLEILYQCDSYSRTNRADVGETNISLVQNHSDEIG